MGPVAGWGSVRILKIQVIYSGLKGVGNGLFSYMVQFTKIVKKARNT